MPAEPEGPVTAAVAALLNQHEKVYGSLAPPVPVDKIADDTVGVLVDHTEDPRTKMAPGSAPDHVVSGLLLSDDMEVWLRSSEHLHRQRFSLAHELGHLRLHCQPARQSHSGRTVFACGEQEIVETVAASSTMEHEANAFASELLLPTSLVRPRMESRDVSMDLVLELADEFTVSPVCMAIRAARASWQPYAMIVSSDGRVDFSFCSSAMKELTRYTFVRKGTAVNGGTETAKFFRNPAWIEARRQSDHIVDAGRWFLDATDDLCLVEEVKGLGFGQLLTILSLDYEGDTDVDDDE